MAPRQTSKQQPTLPVYGSWAFAPLCHEKAFPKVDRTEVFFPESNYLRIRERWHTERFELTCEAPSPVAPENLPCYLLLVGTPGLALTVAQRPPVVEAPDQRLATRTAIFQELEEILSSLTSDLLLFYFSGHGWSAEDERHQHLTECILPAAETPLPSYQAALAILETCYGHSASSFRNQEGRLRFGATLFEVHRLLAHSVTPFVEWVWAESFYSTEPDRVSVFTDLLLNALDRRKAQRTPRVRSPGAISLTHEHPFSSSQVERLPRVSNVLRNRIRKKRLPRGKSAVLSCRDPRSDGGRQSGNLRFHKSPNEHQVKLVPLAA